MFLGMCRHLAPFIPEISNLTKRLNKLNSPKLKKVNFECEEVKSDIKRVIEVIAENTIRYIPDFDKPFELKADASELRIGGYLFQKGRRGRRKTCVVLLKSLQPHDGEVDDIRERGIFSLLWNSEV